MGIFRNMKTEGLKKGLISGSKKLPFEFDSVSEESRKCGRNEAVISLDGVCVEFDGNLVLNDVSFQVREGEVFGLLGSSGAGKTTLIKVILGLADYCEGKVSVFGKNPREYDGSVYSSFGCVLDGDGLYERLSCFDNLEVFADVYSIENKREMILNLLDRVGLSDARKRKVSDLSKGMRQRLSFARAILHNPKIVILDEPTSGLDPATTLRIHSLVKELQNRGTSFLFTTHNMSEAQKMCGRLALIHRGNIIERGSASEICMRNAGKVRVRIRTEQGRMFETDVGELEKQIGEICSSGGIVWLRFILTSCRWKAFL